MDVEPCKSWPGLLSPGRNGVSMSFLPTPSADAVRSLRILRRSLTPFLSLVRWARPGLEFQSILDPRSLRQSVSFGLQKESWSDMEPDWAFLMRLYFTFKYRDIYRVMAAESLDASTIARWKSGKRASLQTSNYSTKRVVFIPSESYQDNILGRQHVGCFATRTRGEEYDSSMPSYQEVKPSCMDACELFFAFCDGKDHCCCDSASCDGAWTEHSTKTRVHGTYGQAWRLAQFWAGIANHRIEIAGMHLLSHAQLCIHM